MTSDAKIGLLLGLVFIFIIAFVINGLPGLHNKDDGNKLTTNMVGLQNSQTGLGANERRVALQTPETPRPIENVPAPSPVQAADSPETRFTMALPQDSPAATEGAAATPTTTEPAAVTPPQPTTPAAVLRQQDAGAAPSQPAVKSESVKPATAKVYVVQDGDTLSAIAKKVYGDMPGNKLATINAIFEANRKILASADSLVVGQKLTIPALTGANVSQKTPAKMPGGGDFTKAESVGQRHTATAADKMATPAKADSAKTGRIYIVKEGDSLWRIAATQLGDGNRYKEIVRLNSDKLSSEDDIQVDMQLKLPAK